MESTSALPSWWRVAYIFAVHFLDDDMLVPELRPLVFIGWNLEADDASRLYFQDADSYLNGVRHGDGKEADIHCVEDKTPFVFEFDRALDVLLRCSIKRQTQEK